MRFRMVIALIAALSLVSPPAGQAELNCVSVDDADLIYYFQCSCLACTSGASGTCTECWDDETGAYCQNDINLVVCPPENKRQIH